MGAARGYQNRPNYTSDDVSRCTAQYFTDSDSVHELRRIYIRARYHGSATAEESKRA